MIDSKDTTDARDRQSPRTGTAAHKGHYRNQERRGATAHAHHEDPLQAEINRLKLDVEDSEKIG